jgi:hypothetical protein
MFPLRILAGLAGAGLLAGAALLFAWWERIRRLATYDRPPITWQRWFRPAFVTGGGFAAAAGSVLLGLAAAHPLGAALPAAALLVGYALHRVRSSGRVRAYALERRLARFAAARDGAEPSAVRLAFVLDVHPEWGHDLAAQIAADCAGDVALARWVARIEKHALLRYRARGSRT